MVPVFPLIFSDYYESRHCQVVYVQHSRQNAFD